MTQQKSKIGRDWKTFRRRLLFTQSALAQALGISLRQVQYIEAGICIPQYRTQGKFNALKAKHERNI